MLPIFSTSIFVGILTWVLYKLWCRYRFFKLRDEIGVPGPSPSFLYGNLDEVIEKRKEVGYECNHEMMIQYHEKYGKTFGFYSGKRLEIFISEEEMIKEIFVKNFSNFSDRGRVGVFDVNQLNESLLQLTRENGWKEVRSVISPTFSNGKMKAMHEEIRDKINVFLQILEEKSVNSDIGDIYDEYQALTLDVIGKCAFAIECNSQRDRNDVFYQQARRFFKYIDIGHSPLVIFSMILPEFDYLWQLFYKFSNLAKAEEPLTGGLDDVYERRKSGECNESVDLLKLLLDNESSEKALTKRRVIENCFAFLLAGYETTSTALTYCTDLLARHPDVQQKLYEEIVETKEKKGLTFDSIHAMEYLDCVYKESLRVYPPVIHFVNRMCLKDTVIRGQKIPAGVIVNLLPYTVHMSEQNWEEPRKFIPERFLNWSDKSSLKWIPFGVGPRYCVGMRFAEMEFKMTLTRVLEKFIIQKGDNYTMMQPHVQGLIMRPLNPVNLKLTIRDEFKTRKNA